MPNVDGFEVIKHVREVNTTIPIIVLSNLSIPEDINEALKLGATKYLLKSKYNTIGNRKYGKRTRQQ